VGASFSTKVGAPSAPQRYTPSSTRQCSVLWNLLNLSIVLWLLTRLRRQAAPVP
jgi:hypothetical protein